MVLPSFSLVTHSFIATLQHKYFKEWVQQDSFQIHRLVASPSKLIALFFCNSGESLISPHKRYAGKRGKTENNNEG